MASSRHLAFLCFGSALAIVTVWTCPPCARAGEAAVPAVAAAAPTPDLSGVWNLDAGASDDLKAFAKKLGSLQPAGGERGMGGPGGGMGGPGGGMGGPGGGMGGPGGGMGGPGGGMSGPGGGRGRPGGGAGGRMPADELGSGAEDSRDAPPADRGPGGGPGSGLAKAAQQLLISADGDALEIVDGAERSETWVPDGEVHAQAGPGGRESTRRAAWRDGALVLEQFGGPLSLSRRLQLSADGRRLLVDLTAVAADGKPVTAHLEYVGVK
jgi:hypothetical protein